MFVLLTPAQDPGTSHVLKATQCHRGMRREGCGNRAPKAFWTGHEGLGLLGCSADLVIPPIIPTNSL